MSMSLDEVTMENFWDTFDKWVDPSIVSAEFQGNTSLHHKIYEECEKFDDWTYVMDFENMSDDLKLRMIKVSNNEAEPSADADAVKERHKLRGWTGRPTYGNYGPVKSRDGSVLSDDNPVYWWCAPEEKDFPTLYQFMKENPKYTYPVISKMNPNLELVPHHHGSQKQFCYNMSVNEPEGTTLAIYPTGHISYNPGDIYKLYVNNRHSVLNGDGVRYHVLFRGSLIYG